MSDVWLIGAGPMARDYMKVLESLKANYKVVGRGKLSAEECRKICSTEVIEGGLSSFLTTKPTVCKKAIVAVPVESLFSCVCQLIEYGVNTVLVEKPAGLNADEVNQLNRLCQEKNANILLAYNRRFYESVYQAKKIIEEDGGIRSCLFEFTEWSHVIQHLEKPKEVFEKWFVGNSTHVVDLVFHLIGKPKELSTYTLGKLSWHNSAAQFSGAGISERNIIFSYFADWAAPGRWSIELLTEKHRLILKPMEQLKLIKLGTVQEVCIEQETRIDQEFKAGLYSQVESYLTDDFSLHCTISEQSELIDVYYKMANYE